MVVYIDTETLALLFFATICFANSANIKESVNNICLFSKGQFSLALGWVGARAVTYKEHRQPAHDLLTTMVMTMMMMMMMVMMLVMMMICSYHNDDDDVLPVSSLLSLLANNGALG